MEKRRPTLFTWFFILALVALASSFIVSILVREHDLINGKLLGWLAANLYMAIFSIIIISVSFYLIISSSSQFTYSRMAVWAALIFYWASVIIIFIPIVDLFEKKFPYGAIPPRYMLLMSILLPIIYITIEFILVPKILAANSSLTFLSPLRLILFQRFTILGDLMKWMETGWHSIAVKFIDVLLAVWLVQSTMRVLLQTTGDESLFNFRYTEILLLPANPSNGSIFDSFSRENQSNLMAISFSGHNFFQDLVSSISSLLLNHWSEIIALWFLLEFTGFFWESSKKLIIVDASESPATSTGKRDEAGKKTDSEPQPVSSSISDLLVLKLDKINKIYRFVDEKRSIRSTCGAGEPINAAIKVESLDNISMSSSSQIELGPISIPVNSMSAMISHLFHGPRIVISLRSRDPDEVSDIRGKFFLTASMTRKEGSFSWIVDSDHPLEADSREKVRTVEDMVTEMAHKIFTSLKAGKAGQNIAWKAMWNFNEGLSAYRDCLRSSKGHRISLSNAERKFMDAIEEQNSFSLAYYNLGVVYAEINQLNSAEACFQKAIEADQELWEAYYAQGIAAFLRAKERDELHVVCHLNKIQDGSMDPTEKRRIEEGYEKAIRLSQRVLDIKSRQDGIFESDSARAKAYDLKGNAQARLACIKCPARVLGGPCRENSENESEELYLAKEYLEKAVHYSWIASMKESVLKEETEDEVKIVSECSLDLADVYLKMRRCPGCYFEDNILLSAKSVLMQAIFIDPNQVNLYKFLGKVYGELKNDDYAGEVYSYALQINPECHLLRAHIAATKVKNKNGPIAWLEELEKYGCIDEKTHERAIHFLTQAIEEKLDFEIRGLDYDNSVWKPFYEREKLEGYLSKISQLEKDAISSLLRKTRASQGTKYTPEICRALCSLARKKEDENFDNQCLDIAMTELDQRLINRNYMIDLEALLPEGHVKKERLMLANDRFLLEQIYFEKYMSRECEGKAECMISPQDLNSWSLSVPTPNVLMLPDCTEIYNESWANLLLLLEYVKMLLVPEKSGQDWNYSHSQDLYSWSLSVPAPNKLMLPDCAEVKIYSTNFYKKLGITLLLEFGKMLLELGNSEKTSKPDRCEYFETAREAISRSIDILERVDPDEIKSNNAKMHLAKAYKGCEEHRYALKEAERARDLNPLDHELRKVLGDIFCALKEYHFGLEELENALSCNPDDADLMLTVGRAYYFAGKDCRKKGADRDHLLKTAKGHLEHALDIEVKSKVNQMEKILYWLGRTLIEMGRYDEAIPHLNILSESRSSGALAKLCLGYSYWKCNAHGDAEKVLSELVSIGSSLVERKVIGRELDAEMDVNELMARAHIYLAYSYVERGSNIHDSWMIAYRSQKYIRDIKEYEFSNGDVSFIHVEHELEKNKDSKIIIDSQSDGPKKRKVKAHLAECAGTICYKGRETDAAIEYLEASIALYPDAGAYLNLAKALARKILRGGHYDPEKELICMEIQELCLHADSLDIKDEHKKDLDEFKEHMREKEILPEVSVESKPS
ncbi:MAG: tetratricopeptide repeat protein [Methanothrix sp.]|nr:tetratricopeptide repeat protein [Methanothrix sp.]